MLSGVEPLVYVFNVAYWTIQHKSVLFSECVTNVCLVSYSSASSLSDRSKCFTLHTLACLFLLTQSRLLREDFTRESPAFYHILVALQRMSTSIVRKPTSMFHRYTRSNPSTKHSRDDYERKFILRLIAIKTLCSTCVPKPAFLKETKRFVQEGL